MGAQRKSIIGMRNLAKHLGVHYNTIYNWRRSGLLKYKQKGKTLIFDSEDYLEEIK